MYLYKKKKPIFFFINIWLYLDKFFLYNSCLAEIIGIFFNDYYYTESEHSVSLAPFLIKLQIFRNIALIF